MAIPTDPNHPSDPTDRLLTSRGLSAREIEIARLLADGHTNPEMAAALHLSVRTVEHHRASVFRKLRSRAVQPRYVHVARTLPTSGVGERDQARGAIPRDGVGHVTTRRDDRLRPRSVLIHDVDLPAVDVRDLGPVRRPGDRRGRVRHCGQLSGLPGRNITDEDAMGGRGSGG